MLSTYIILTLIRNIRYCLFYPFFHCQTARVKH